MECFGMNQVTGIKDNCPRLKERERNKGMNKRRMIKGIKGALSGKQERPQHYPLRNTTKETCLSGQVMRQHYWEKPS